MYKKLQLLGAWKHFITEFIQDVQKWNPKIEIELYITLNLITSDIFCYSHKSLVASHETLLSRLPPENTGNVNVL